MASLYLVMMHIIMALSINGSLTQLLRTIFVGKGPIAPAAEPVFHITSSRTGGGVGFEVGHAMAQGIQHRYGLDHCAILIQQLTAGVAGVVQFIASVGAVSGHGRVLGLVCMGTLEFHTALNEFQVNIFQIAINKVTLFITHGHSVFARSHLVRDLKGQSHHYTVAGICIQAIPNRSHRIGRQVTGRREGQAGQCIALLNALQRKSFGVCKCQAHIRDTRIFRQSHMQGNFLCPQGHCFRLHCQTAVVRILRHDSSHDHLQQKCCQDDDG